MSARRRRPETYDAEVSAKAIVEQATAGGIYQPGDGKTPAATLYTVWTMLVNRAA